MSQGWLLGALTKAWPIAAGAALAIMLCTALSLAVNLDRGVGVMPPAASTRTDNGADLAARWQTGGNAIGERPQLTAPNPEATHDDLKGLRLLAIASWTKGDRAVASAQIERAESAAWYELGQVVAGGWVLAGVEGYRVYLQHGQARVVLELKPMRSVRLAPARATTSPTQELMAVERPARDESSHAARGQVLEPPQDSN